VIDARPAFPVKLVKLRGKVLGRRVELGGDRDEPKSDFTGPEGAHLEFSSREA
jgi:hypothetical protein